MKLEKEITDISIFEKKTISIEQLKEKLIEYQKINDKFMFWEYTVKDNQMHDNIKNYFLFTIIGLLPSFFCTLIMMDYLGSLISLSLVVFGNIGIMSFLRNLKFGVLKNRYKKWQTLQKDIQNIMQDQTNVFYILLETELNLKSLQQKIVENEELKALINESIEKLTEELKELFANYDNSIEGMVKITEKLNEIQNYNEEISKAIKTYQLKTDYIDYKKTQGIVENNTEKETLNSNIIRNFKAIL